MGETTLKREEEKNEIVGQTDPEISAPDPVDCLCLFFFWLPEFAEEVLELTKRPTITIETFLFPVPLGCELEEFQLCTEYSVEQTTLCVSPGHSACMSIIRLKAYLFERRIHESKDFIMATIPCPLPRER
ncbi:hypothetical protein CISG_04170 [Coccidioides immitis RMSCC 3703]|uniref:Uncharacterized protein n=2 Tax=Coccidioides immitis TaxID=5501 RepID=A0A0J8QRU3_COCIT|nr:hypothetical protein CIRG_06570 [Coccidioides immitis RMSCC 2394]KMU75221.1 hypothetical protein CISG_04170 [Coccidioides immitis RMSCC 3703]